MVDWEEESELGYCNSCGEEVELSQFTECPNEDCQDGEVVPYDEWNDIPTPMTAEAQMYNRTPDVL